MSAGIKVVESDAVPISLVVETGDGTKFPTAFVYNEVGSQIATRNLNHVSNGLYLPSNSFTMPSNDFITVVYVVFDDALRTQRNEDLGNGFDIFLRETVHQITWDEFIADHLTAGTTGATLNLLNVLDLDNLLSGFLPSDITATVESDEAVVGVVSLNESNVVALFAENDQVFAVISDEETVKSNIESNNGIIGVVNEC